MLHTHTQTQTDRQTHKQTHTHTHTQTDRHTNRHTHTCTHTHTDTQTDIHIHICVCVLNVSCCADVCLLAQCYHVEASDAANFGYAFEVQTIARTHLFVSERHALLPVPSHPAPPPITSTPPSQAARTEEERQKWIDVITEKMGGKAV